MVTELPISSHGDAKVTKSTFLEFFIRIVTETSYIRLQCCDNSSDRKSACLVNMKKISPFENVSTVHPLLR